MFIAQYMKESPEGNYRVEIYENSDGYFIECYDPTGNRIKTQLYNGVDIYAVTAEATKWLSNIKVLKG